MFKYRVHFLTAYADNPMRSVEVTSHLSNISVFANAVRRGRQVIHSPTDHGHGLKSIIFPSAILMIEEVKC